MARRTKEELIQSNYYEWLEYCNSLREQKKTRKLIPAEKQVMRTVPTPESPFVSKSEDTPKPVAPKKKLAKVKIDFDKNVVWPVKGNAFLCAVFNAPLEDSQCMLFCDRDDCPFNGIGYFRAHGVKF